MNSSLGLQRARRTRYLYTDGLQVRVDDRPILGYVLGIMPGLRVVFGWGGMGVAGGVTGMGIYGVGS